MGLGFRLARSVVWLFECCEWQTSRVGGRIRWGSIALEAPVKLCPPPDNFSPTSAMRIEICID